LGRIESSPLIAVRLVHPAEPVLCKAEET